MKRAKYIVFLLSICVSIFILLFAGKFFPPSVFYWLWLILIIEAIIFFKVSSGTILKIGLGSTILGALLAIFSPTETGRVLLIGFVFLIVGYLLNILEIISKKDVKKI